MHWELKDEIESSSLAFLCPLMPRIGLFLCLSPESKVDSFSLPDGKWRKSQKQTKEEGKGETENTYCVIKRMERGAKLDDPSQ